MEAKPTVLREAAGFDLKPDDRLIVALDVPNAAAAQALVRQIGDACVFYKVGLQLFAAEGSSLVRELVRSGKKVFLDLKFHDIPNTVSGAVRSAAELSVEMLTVHASGGSKMLRAAVEAASSCAVRPKILAVTMLTSLAPDDLKELGLGSDMPANVRRLAEVAHKSGCDGVVASPHEAAEIRKSVGTKFLIVTPGIRASGSTADDQSRTASPVEAIRAGATHLVVGRPVTAAPDPAESARNILKQISQA